MPHDRDALKSKLVDARRQGQILAEAAAAAGVHVATVCRWQAADPTFAKAMRAAEQAARAARYASLPARRPPVPWHPGCPACGAAAEVRTAWVGFRFWWCSRWPGCRWASWRPRHPADCSGCGGPRFWSHSRKTAGCPRCRVRISAH